MTTITNEWDKSATELDFEKHWSSLNIQQEVLRGVELRERKPQSFKTKYDLINIPLPSSSKCPGSRSPIRYKTRKVTKKRRLKKISKDRNCPLRVVELAEPSKLHSLHTLKNNYRTLPDYMVERLRKHIMDEQPVVRISDAVNYFKRRKTPKKSTNRNIKATSKKTQDSIMILCSLFAYNVTQKLIKPVNIVLNEELVNINNVVAGEINRILRNKKTDTSNYKKDRILNEISKKITIWIADILEETSYKQLLEQLEELEEKEGPVLDILGDLFEKVEIICKSSSSSSSVLSDDRDSIHSSLSIENAEDINETADDNTYTEKSDYDEQLDKDKILKEDFGTEYHIKRLLEERINDVVKDNDYINVDDNYISNTDKIIDLLSKSRSENNATDLNQALENNRDLPSDTENDFTGKEEFLQQPNEPSNISLNSFSGSTVANISEQNDILPTEAVVDENMSILSVEDLDEDTKKVKFSDINIGNGESRLEINKCKLINKNVLSPSNRNSFEQTQEYKQPVSWKSSKEFILSHYNVAPPNPNLLSNNDEVWPESTLPPLLKASESVVKSVTSLGNITEVDDENITHSPTHEAPVDDIEKVLNKQLDQKLTGLIDKDEISDVVNEHNYVKESGNNMHSRNKYNKDLQGDDLPPSESPKQFSEPSATEEDVRVKVRDSKIRQALKTNVSDRGIAKDWPGHDKPSHKDLGVLSLTDENESKEIQKQKDIRTLQPNIGIKEIDKHRQEHYSYQNNLQLNPPTTIPSRDMTLVREKQKLYDGGNVKKNKTMQLNEKHGTITYYDSANKTFPSSSKTPVNYNYVREYKKEKTRDVTNIHTEEFYIPIKDILKWCMGLQSVTENLVLWAAWIDNVCLNVLYLKHQGMKTNIGAFKYKHIGKWIILSENINEDVERWSQLRKRLRRGLHTYKRSYNMNRKDFTNAIPFHQKKTSCGCYNNSQKYLC